jgi:hypothetical protein
MICDECETVAHCLKNGCVPKQPSKDEALKRALEFVDANHSGGQDAFELINTIKQALAAPDPKDRRSAWVHATEWRGLTDEEIGMCLDVGDGSMSKIIYAIEAKLKEKNT